MARPYRDHSCLKPSDVAELKNYAKKNDVRDSLPAHASKGDTTSY